uniref:Uncharacterized protein n=1 Tax=Moorena producens (strain JHB) TaxID=1454205 RepID=A0A1D9G8J3_MOOP1
MWEVWEVWGDGQMGRLGSQIIDWHGFQGAYKVLAREPHRTQTIRDCINTDKKENLDVPHAY